MVWGHCAFLRGPYSGESVCGGCESRSEKRLYGAQNGKNAATVHFFFMDRKNILFAKQFYMHQKSQIDRQYVTLENKTRIKCLFFIEISTSSES